FSFLLAAAAWFSLGPHPSEALTEVGWRAQLVAGLRWVRHHRVILENTLSGVVLNIVYAAVTTVFVYYAQHELHFDAARTGLALGLSGGGAILGRILLRSYVQAAVPPQLLGRVNATIRVVAWGGVPVGAVLGGTLTQLIGVLWLIALASVTSLLLFLAFALASETKRI